MATIYYYKYNNIVALLVHPNRIQQSLRFANMNSPKQPPKWNVPPPHKQLKPYTMLLINKWKNSKRKWKSTWEDTITLGVMGCSSITFSTYILLCILMIFTLNYKSIRMWKSAKKLLRFKCVKQERLQVAKARPIAANDFVKGKKH